MNKLKNNKNPTESYLDPFLGKYQFISGNHKKFWECLYDIQTDNFVVRWGRIGSKPRKMTVDFYKARTKIDEKRRKGYTYINNSFKTYQEVNKDEIYKEVEKVIEKKIDVMPDKKIKRRM